MMSGILSAELSATCNALGYSTGTTYHTDPYAKETITDLIRYLRRDEEDHSIRRHLGKAKILQTDLLPILIHHSDKEELFDVLLRLLVNLTNPALLIYQEELPGDRTSRHYFMQIISHLQSYKEAFTQQRVWEVLAGKLETLLNVPYQERDEDQTRTMERILILARNVLQVPADAEGEKRPDNDASVHDQVLWCLHQAGMVDLFLYIASTDREQQYYMHILEIVSLMLREQNPASLASAALQRSVEEKERDEKELLELRRRETLEKQSKMKKYAGSRHSRFGGTFVMKDVKSISDKDLIYHKPLNKAVSLTLDFEKQRARVPKNKVALSYHPSERRSAFSVRLFLKEFCVEFLNGAYNSLMCKVRENLVRAVSQPNDETYYFWAMKFFMEFNRLYKFQVKLVSETMHQQIFHFVQTQIENWLEMMITDKKHIPVWSRRVHQALKAYQELLMTLQEMDRSPDESVRRSATVIKSNVFYQSEHRELVIFLFNIYTEMKFSRAYLKDLVETTHIFMKILEQFCKRHQNLVVLGKPKRKAVKKKKPAKSRPGQVDLEALWDGVGPELSAVLQVGAGIPSDVVPFDATSGRSMDEEKVEAMKRIKAEMMQSNFEQAVGLLRTSREVWPENDCFGRADMPPEEEFMAMREIFMADIGQLPEVAAPQEENEDENEADDEEEGDEQDIVIPESVFKFSEFVGRIACPKVLAPVCLLLDSFEQNSAFTNKCIVKLLHRVAMNCKLPQMLFQGTVFQTFQRAFKSTNPDHKELARLGNYIVREFVRMAKTNNQIYMELLFWKNNKEAYELEYGYGSSDTKSHSAKNVWGEEQEDELRRLAQEYEDKTPEDEPDAVDWIMKNMINQSRSRKAVIKKLKELYLVVGNMKPKKSKEMSEEEISQLKSLYEEYKDSSDPMNCILGRLSVQRGRNSIVNKLLELGLISSRKELRKKRAKKSGNSGKELKWGDRSDDESIYDSWSDDNGGPSTSALKEKKAIKSRVGQPTVPQMCCNLKKVIDAGEELREALEWLQSSLQEVLDDLPDAEDDDEGTALLPLTPSCVQATDNPTFMQLMDILSIHKPTDQERYWRIPGSWKAEDLSTRINLIKDALEGKLPDINPDEVEESVKLPGIPLNKPKEVKKNKPRKKVKNVLEQFVRESGDSASEDALQLSLHSDLDGNESRPQRKISSGDSSSDDNGIGLLVPSTSKQGKKINKRKLGLLKIDSGKESTDSSKSGTLKPLITKKRLLRVQSESEDEISMNTLKIANAKPFQINFHNSDSNDNKIITRESSWISPVPQEMSNSSSNNDSAIIRKIKSIESDSDDEIGNAFSNFKSVTNEHKLKRKKLSIESDSEDNANISVNTTKSSAPQNEMSSTSVRNERTNNGEKKKPRIEKYPDENIDDQFDSERTEIIVWSQESERSSKTENIDVKDDSERTEIIVWSQESDINSKTVDKSVIKRERLTFQSNSDSIPATIDLSSQESDMKSKYIDSSVVKNKRPAVRSVSHDSVPATIYVSSQESDINSKYIDLSFVERKISAVRSVSHDSVPATIDLTSQESDMSSKTFDKMVVKRKRLTVESDSDDSVPITIDLLSQESNPIDVLPQESNMSNIFYKTAGKRKKLTVESDSDDSVPTTIALSSQESDTSSKTVGLSDVRRKRLTDKSNFDENNDSILNSTETSSSAQKTNDGLKFSSSIQYGYGISSGEFSNLDAPPRENNLDSEISVGSISQGSNMNLNKL